jgi:hypothetical protein
MKSSAEASSMARYFFHVRNGESAFDDEMGEVHSTPDGAVARAAQIARELAAEPESYRGYSVIVTDEDGNEIANVLIAETV